MPVLSCVVYSTALPQRGQSYSVDSVHDATNNLLCHLLRMKTMCCSNQSLLQSGQLHVGKSRGCDTMYGGGELVKVKGALLVMYSCALLWIS